MTKRPDAEVLVRLYRAAAQTENEWDQMMQRLRAELLHAFRVAQSRAKAWSDVVGVGAEEIHALEPVVTARDAVTGQIANLLVALRIDRSVAAGDNVEQRDIERAAIKALEAGTITIEVEQRQREAAVKALTKTTGHNG